MKKYSFTLWASVLFCLYGNAQQSERLTVINPGTPNSGSRIALPLSTPSQNNQGERKPAGMLVTRNTLTSLTTGTDRLVNNNLGGTTTGYFTQSTTGMVSYGNHVVVAFNDAGSDAGGAPHFTGFAYSEDGGSTFIDGGTLPPSAGGDGGEPVMARNNITGRIYLITLGFNVSTIQVFRSDDHGHTWLPPVNGTPLGNTEDKPWITVDNFAGAGNGNVYLVSRRFGGVQGLYFYKSTDQGNTFSFGLPMTFLTSQGGFVTVAPDHSIYVFWLNGTAIFMRKSMDGGATFSSPAIVAAGLIGGVNGDLGLIGSRQGAIAPVPFRSNEFPHVAINPVSGHIYVTYANRAVGDKADIFFVMSADGGTTWTAPMRVNDDATQTDQWIPTIAVTPDGNNLGIFYYSRQNDVIGNNLYQYYGRVGSISGSTISFAPSFAISDVPSFPEMGRDFIVNPVYLIDADQPAAVNDGFHVTWSDSRSDLPGGAPRKDPNIYHDFISLGTSVTTLFYSKPAGNLHDLATWGSNLDGSGTNPTDFGTGKTFTLSNRAGNYEMTGDWTVEGLIMNSVGSVLKLNGFSLTESGMQGGGMLAGTPTSDLNIMPGTGDAGLLSFAPGFQMLENFTLNRPAGSATLTANVEIFNELNVVSGTFLTNDHLILNSDASGTAHVRTLLPGATIAGNVTVERYIPARRAWRILSAPIFAGQTINQAWQEGTTNVSADPNPFPGFGTHITGGSALNGFDQNPGASSSIKMYNSSTDTWNALSNTNVNGVGLQAYMTFIRGDRGISLSSSTVPPTATTLRAKGPLWTGDWINNVSATGFTAVPNPFASPVDFATMPKMNVQNTVWLWDPKMGGTNGVGAYVSVSFNGTGWEVTPASVSPESQIIQSGQGFLVHSIVNAPAQIVIRETDKSASPAADVFRQARNSSGLRITLQTVETANGTSVLDEVFSSFSNYFSNEVDALDVPKLSNMEENLALVHSGQLLMVDRGSLVADADEMRLRLWNTKQKEYVFHFSPENLSPALPAWLIDKYTGSVQEIPLDRTYDFHFIISQDPASAAAERFKVIFSARKPAAQAITLNEIKVYPNPVTGKVVTMEFTEVPDGHYRLIIVNSLGQKVAEQELDHQKGTLMEKISLKRSLANGMYSLQITGKDLQLTKQLLVK